MSETKNTQAAQEVSQNNPHEGLIIKYKNTIICVLVALVVCLCACFFIKSYTTSKFNTASTDMAKAQEYFSLAVINNDTTMYEKALNGDSINAGFLALTDNGSAAGNLANLYAGLCYAHLGKMEEAASYLEEFDATDDANVSPAAIGALADVKATLGSLDEAVELFVKAAKEADNNSLSPQYLIKAGEILESQGKKDEALKLYEEVKAKYLNSVEYRSIDAYIERVK